MPLWFWLALGGVALVAFAMKKGLISDLTGLAQAAIGNPESFAASLPSAARPYADIILQVAQEKGVDPYIIAAIGQQESRWGQALRPAGPTGTGDFTPRTWTTPSMPPDGKGWGRGLMQLDYNVYGNSVDWADPLTNVRLAADHILNSVNYFTSMPSGTVELSGTAASRRGVGPGSYPDVRPLADNALSNAVIAAYNTGDRNVLMSLAVGQNPDVTTSGGSYASNALNNALTWARNFLA